jgi:uncharacterized protein
MWVKIHKSYRITVAVCDNNLLGKKFIELPFQLDVRENFYKGEEKTHKEVVEIMKFEAKEDATFSIVGKESVATAIEAGLISKEGFKTIHGIPYALVLL